MSKLGEDVDHGAKAYGATGSVRRNRRREVDGIGELDRPRQGRHHFSMGGFNPEVRESVAEEDLIRSFGVETFPGAPVEF